MRRISWLRLMGLSGLVALTIAPAFAAEPGPGSACTGAGNYTVAGGPELSGVGHLMVCSGSVWNSVLDFDATANSVLPYGLSLSGDISPAQITADQNDYSPTGLSTASVLRLNSDASRNITSLAGGADGRIITLMNIGSNPIVLKNDDGATGTAANRFALTGDLTLAAKQSAMLMYDSTALRWRQIANGTATGSGDNLGNHTATQNIVLGSNYVSGDGDAEGIKVGTDGYTGIMMAGTPLAMLQVGDVDGSGSHHAVGIGEADDNDAGLYGTGYVGFNLTGGDNSYSTGSDTASNGAAAIVGNLYGRLHFVTVPETGGSAQSLTASDIASDVRMTITEDGKVGIGTAAPTTNLHVYSEDAYGVALSVATDGVGAGSQAMLDLMTKSDGGDKLGDSTSAGWQLWANGYSSTNYSSLGGPNTFGIGFVDGAGWEPAALQILPDGKVGIGTHDANKLPETTLEVGGSFGLSNDITPAAITANKNNYNPTDIDKASVLRLSSDASRTITGIVGGVDGRVLTILNVGANPIVLANQNASSAADDRFALGADLTIDANQSTSLIYDDTSQRWRQIASAVPEATGAMPSCSENYAPVMGASGWTCYCPNPQPTGTTWIGRDSVRDWFGVASSSDGTKLAAVVSSGQIYTSTDSGATWIARDSNRTWRDVASSSDGTKLVAVVSGGRIYTSTDSGVTWTQRDSNRTWHDVASSSDGIKLVAVVTGGRIYTSTDSGVTWTQRDSNRDWYAVASSSDGTKLVAVVQNGQIYTSADSGATWIARDSTRAWEDVASSSDGSKLVATVDNGQIYTSIDSGATWTARDNNRRWRGIASSSDGTKLAGEVYNDAIYTSADSGVTWTQRAATQRDWRNIASSSDGMKLVATTDTDLIYTSEDGGCQPP